VRLLGVLVAIAVGVLALWLLVDLAWYLWGALGALFVAFLLIFLVTYVLDRRKVKEYEDLPG
jgi:membrane protein implicated in regulation of membrane protease activity